MYYIGIDLGSSSIKVSLTDAQNGKAIKTVQEPETEMQIISNHEGWAEQDPEVWWKYTCKAIKNLCTIEKIQTRDIIGIGIAYQMHGLVVVDKIGKILRNSIIWCDSRAVSIGNQAFNDIGEENSMKEMLNSPANFTASKLKWIQVHEPDIYSKIFKIMLPGDFIAYKLSGVMATTKSGLSEGVFWNFKEDKISETVLNHYQIESSLIPDLVPTFGKQGEVSIQGENASGLAKGTPILYRAGDQPNNALSLNVLHPGEIAATGGTSGVLYAVTESLKANEGVKFNNFAHVNHTQILPRIGKLLCINGCGIQYRWLKDHLKLNGNSYSEMNKLASYVDIGSQGLICIPFGNGAERMFNNKTVGTHFMNLNLTLHSKEHLCRATLEGIAFAFVYGMEILKKDDTEIKVIRAGNDNLFRAPIFSETIATLINQDIEIYDTTGAIGAARAAGLASGTIKSMKDAISGEDHIMTYSPLKNRTKFQRAYENWLSALQLIIQ